MRYLKLLTEIGRNGELLLALPRKEFAVRYKQSVIWPQWAFLQPLILMALFVMIQHFIHIDSGEFPYPVVVYAALLPWSFFGNSMHFATGSIVNNSAIIRKIYCPRAIFPLASILASLVDFFIAFPFLLALLAYYRIGISWHLAALPLLLVVQLFLTYGLALLTSSVAAYRRDVWIGMPYVLQFWMFASPVMYRVESVPGRWRALYALNPMAGIVDGYRSILVYDSLPEPSSLLPAMTMAVLLFAAGLVVFAKLETRFADVV